MRSAVEKVFDTAFDDMVSQMRWQEEAQYYPRNRWRYLAILEDFARTVPEEGIELLEVGGGQLAYLATRLWGRDSACVADIDDRCFPGLNNHGIDTVRWNVAVEDAPIKRRFDAIFFSEVIEHIPVPGHIALRRLHELLRPGGILLCSTPNLYRLRNVAFMIYGRPLFDHFDLPGDRGFGHVLEYSAEHLSWQFEKAGFRDFTVEFRDFKHVPNRRTDRILYVLGSGLHPIPRVRNNLMVVARASADCPARTAAGAGSAR